VDPRLELRVLTSERELDALRMEWGSLWERCPWATPFQAPEWQLPWWRHLGGGTLRVLTLRHGSRLVGLAPFFIHGARGAPRELSLMGIGHSDYEDILLDPAIAPIGMRQLVGSLAEWGSEWDTAVLHDVRAGSPLLEAVGIPALRVEVRPSSVCPVVPLPETRDELEGRVTPRHRRKLHLSRNRIARSGGARFEVATTESWAELLEWLFRLHEARWRSRGESGVTADERVRRMHREIVPAFLVRGVLRLAALRLRGMIAAVFYGFAWRGRLYCYLSGIDLGLQYYSPGTALLRFVIERAIDEGMREVDLLRGQEPYKYLWGAVDHRNYDLVLHHAAPAPATLGAGAPS
jgi:CelD/BcsL family acetyltransferase involved in cellulose biosynthesis